jgi:hypothetical protein
LREGDAVLPWTRPDPHADFATDAAALLADLRVDVAKRNGKPHSDDFENRQLWTASWKHRQQVRGLHKAALVGPEPWSTKCAWCEQLRPWKREIDVEHNRPKVWVTEWAGAPPFVSDTPPSEIDVGPGYWWLAFEWKNYSLSCKTCNQGWKRRLFPVVAPRPTCVEGVEHIEKPLLLDPGSTFRPREHFRWTIEGIMEPISPEGYATIVTCGLNRKDLLVRREKVAIKTKKTLARFTGALERDDIAGHGEAFADLAQLGSRSEEFTSMVRWLVEERLECLWEELKDMPP